MGDHDHDHDIFDDIVGHPEVAFNLRNQDRLLEEIRDQINAEGWTEAEVAKRLGISGKDLSYLYRGYQSKFSLEELLNMLAALKS